MSSAAGNSKLKIMMIYGWQFNAYVEYVARSLVERGIQVVLAIRKVADLITHDRPYSVHRIFPKKRKGGSILLWGIWECIALVRLARLSVATKPDIVHFGAFRFPHIDWLFFLFVKILRKNVVFTLTRYPFGPVIYRRFYHEPGLCGKNSEILLENPPSA